MNKDRCFAFRYSLFARRAINFCCRLLLLAEELSAFAIRRNSYSRLWVEHRFSGAIATSLKTPALAAGVHLEPKRSLLFFRLVRLKAYSTQINLKGIQPCRSITKTSTAASQAMAANGRQTP